MIFFVRYLNRSRNLFVDSFLLIFVLALTISFGLSGVITAVFKLLKFTDPNLEKKRAVHKQPTSRLGGLAVILATLASLKFSGVGLDYKVAAAVLPVFLMGLLEDLGFVTSARLRLVVAAIGASIFVSLKGLWFQHLNVPGLDFFLAMPWFGIAFTVFALTGLTHAINLIDGVNGLASGKVIIATGAIYYLATIYGTPEIQVLALAILAASMGLFLLNYPVGRIFMGDAGSYSLGLLVGICLVTLKVHRPEVSGWALLLVVFWPVMDTLHSIVRRILGRGRFDRPDMMHMHHLIMRSLIVASDKRLSQKYCNPIATAVILPFATIPVLIACVWPEQHYTLAFTAIMCGAGFWIAYYWLIKLNRSGSVRGVFAKWIK